MHVKLLDLGRSLPVDNNERCRLLDLGRDLPVDNSKPFNNNIDENKNKQRVIHIPSVVNEDVSKAILCRVITKVCISWRVFIHQT